MIWRGVDLGAVSLDTLALDGASGREWYVDSRRAIESWADSLGVPADYACDVLAILSPRVTVGHSVKLADAYIRTGSAPGAMRARLHALARYEYWGTFNGPKVNAFAAALQGDASAIVVDAWMFRAARETSTSLGAYNATAALVSDCAARLGWPGAETQAAIWQGARSFVGYHSGYAPMSFEGVSQ